MESRKIEAYALNALENRINRCNTLAHDLKSQDKKIALDGEIEVYASNQFTKDNFKGSIPVQIKGKEKKAESISHTKYDIELADLRIFKETGGVLFFVVHNIETDNPKIFYKTLLPYDLALILNDDREIGNTKRLKLKPFPNDAHEIERICNDFLRDRKSQRSINTIGIKSLEELQKNKIPIESICYTKTLYKNESLLSIGPYVHGTYIYARSAIGQLYAIDKIENIAQIQGERNATVSSGNIAFEALIKTQENLAGEFLISFLGFEIHLNQKNVQLTYTDKGTFKERLNGAQMAAAIFETQTLSIDGSPILEKIKFNDGFGVEEIKKRANVYQKYVNTFENLRIKTDWDLKCLTDKDIRNLSFVVDTLDKEITLKSKFHATQIIDVEVADNLIKLILEKHKDNSCRVVDLLDPQQNLYVCSYDPETKMPNPCLIPSLLIFNENDYCRACNLDDERFRIELESAPITNNYARLAQQKISSMLNAYDKGAACPYDLIKIAERLCKQLSEMDPNNSATIVDFLQIKKRQGKVSDKDKVLLRKIASDKNNADDYELLASVYMLLDDLEMVNAYLGHMNEQEKLDFLDKPICSFFRKS